MPEAQARIHLLIPCGQLFLAALDSEYRRENPSHQKECSVTAATAPTAHIALEMRRIMHAALRAQPITLGERRLCPTERRVGHIERWSHDASRLWRGCTDLRSKAKH